MSNKSLAFELLDPKVQRWIWDQEWSSLRDIQENSIPFVLNCDSDVIISASTAGGKTEAAFLPILSRLLQDGTTDGYSVLYISPLKALINDQDTRLKNMTSNMNIDVISWHGDINVSQKRRSLKNLNGIIIITPESLESFLINRRQYLNPAFSSLKYIVIDELHSFIGNERGRQLQSLLCRIEIIAKRTIPRIAMSATFSSYDVAKHFLRPNGALPCRIPPEGDSVHEIKVLIKEYLPTKDCNLDDDIVAEIYNKLRGSNNLVFANSRATTEHYAVKLTDLCDIKGVPNEFRIHHGSLSKIERRGVENDLQKGENPITAICTSTLELGVDIGNVKSIVQIGCANSVSSLRQRLGRSGRRNEPSILRILSIEDINNPLFYDLRCVLIQNIAVVELLKDKRYEIPSTNRYHLSTLIQQILSVLAQYGSFYPKDGWHMLCQSGAFRNVTSSLFLDVLRALGENNIIARLQNGQIVIGKSGEKIVNRKEFYVAFQSSDEFTIINKSSYKIIGQLQLQPMIGEVFIISAQRWIVETVDYAKRHIYVSKIVSGGKAMFLGGGADIERIITEQMKQIYISDEQYLYLDKIQGCLNNLNHGRERFKYLGLNKTNFITTFDGNVLFATWAGEKINRTISLIILYYLNITVEYDYIFVNGVTEAIIIKLLNFEKPIPYKLSELVKPKIKQTQKYDYLLSEKLLNMEYAMASLDVDNAWATIEFAILNKM